jgi:hypothetical protein
MYGGRNREDQPKKVENDEGIVELQVEDEGLCTSCVLNSHTQLPKIYVIKVGQLPTWNANTCKVLSSAARESRKDLANTLHILCLILHAGIYKNRKKRMLNARKN